MLLWQYIEVITINWLLLYVIRVLLKSGNTAEMTSLILDDLATQIVNKRFAL